jgi:hypothetical protein
MSLMRDYKCLMIKTKDRRKFFTHEKNYLPLLEFSKIFKAEVSIVKVREAEVLALHDLAPALCDPNYIIDPQPEYQVLQVKMPQSRRQRQDILKNATRIRRHIRKQFLSGKEVSLKKLCAEFARLKMTSACLCNHMRMVREELEKEGYQFEKTGGGKYKKAL